MPATVGVRSVKEEIKYLGDGGKGANRGYVWDRERMKDGVKEMLI